jgi:predicted MPP superfamily phosphohydrolase
MNFLNNSLSEKETDQWLEKRVGRLHLWQRLGIERDHESQVIGQGRNFFHIENWYSIHFLIRASLKLALLYGRGRRNTLAIETRHNTFTLSQLPAAFNGYSVLHISDLHLDMHPEFPDALIEKIRHLEYDICVLTGDFRASTHGPIKPAVDALQKLRPYLTQPVYAVLGNHDSIRMVPCMEMMGIRVLLNESIPLTRSGESIYLAGIDDPHYFRADNLEKASEDIPYHSVSILLSHSPEIYRNAAHAGFDVMLSGHTHGGQICLPGGTPIMCNVACPRTYCRGPWRYHQLQGYTSVGSGTSVVDVRLNCPPEITLHKLHNIHDANGNC